MDELDPVFDAVAAYFSVLSEPTRLRIMHAICEIEKPVAQIVEELAATQTNVSRHLSLMYRAGVLTRRKEGNQVYYRVADHFDGRDLPHRVQSDRRANGREKAHAARTAETAARPQEASCMKVLKQGAGRIKPAPEQRRAFLRKALAFGGGGRTRSAKVKADGDPAILKLPAALEGARPAGRPRRLRPAVAV